MVHTTRHKTPRPRPKQNYVLVSYGKANEGLVFGEPFSSLRYPQDCFLSSFLPLHGLASRALVGGIQKKEHEEEVKDERVRVSRPQACNRPTSLPFLFAHFLAAKTGCLKECFPSSCQARKAGHCSQHVTDIY